MEQTRVICPVTLAHPTRECFGDERAFGHVAMDIHLLSNLQEVHTLEALAWPRSNTAQHLYWQKCMILREGFKVNELTASTKPSLPY